MKILLIRPYIEDFFITPNRLEPLGLEYIAAALQKCGFEWEYIDLLLPLKWKKIPIPKEFEFFKNIVIEGEKGPFSIYSSYKHFGKSLQQVKNILQKKTFDIVLISSNFSAYHNSVKEIIKVIKDINPKAIVIIGGNAVYSNPQEILKDKNCDYIILGYGEKKLIKLLQILLQRKEKVIKIPGVGYKKNGKLIINKDDHDINFYFSPVRFKLPKKYIIRRTITATRGCPNACSFCLMPKISKGKFIKRPIEDIIFEMKSLYEEGTREFNFEDDNISYDKNYFKSLLKRIIETFNGKVILEVANGMDTRFIDYEILDLMKKAGFKRIDLPAVSFNNNTIINREIPIFHYINIIYYASSLFDTYSFIIVGFPFQRLKEMVNDFIFICRLPCYMGFSIFYPIPQTKLGNLLKVREIFCRNSAVNYHYNDWSYKHLYTLFRIYRIINFVKKLQSQHQLGLSIKYTPHPKILKKDKIEIETLKKILTDKKCYTIVENRIVEAPVEKEFFKYVIERVFNI